MLKKFTFCKIKISIYYRLRFFRCISNRCHLIYVVQLYYIRITRNFSYLVLNLKIFNATCIVFSETIALCPLENIEIVYKYIAHK